MEAELDALDVKLTELQQRKADVEARLQASREARANRAIISGLQASDDALTIIFAFAYKHHLP